MRNSVSPLLLDLNKSPDETSHPSCVVCVVDHQINVDGDSTSKGFLALSKKLTLTLTLTELIIEDF